MNDYKLLTRLGALILTGLAAIFFVLRFGFSFNFSLLYFILGWTVLFLVWRTAMRFVLEQKVNRLEDNFFVFARKMIGYSTEDFSLQVPPSKNRRLITESIENWSKSRSRHYYYLLQSRLEEFDVFCLISSEAWLSKSVFSGVTFVFKGTLSGTFQMQKRGSSIIIKAEKSSAEARLKEVVDSLNSDLEFGIQSDGTDVLILFPADEAFLTGDYSSERLDQWKQMWALANDVKEALKAPAEDYEVSGSDVVLFRDGVEVERLSVEQFYTCGPKYAHSIELKKSVLDTIENCSSELLEGLDRVRLIKSFLKEDSWRKQMASSEYYIIQAKNDEVFVGVDAYHAGGGGANYAPEYFIYGEGQEFDEFKALSEGDQRAFLKLIRSHML